MYVCVCMWFSVCSSISLVQLIITYVSILLTYCLLVVLPVLLGRTFASDLAEKHGALLAIAELATAWCSLQDKLV